jgi:voltage-gated potassium channel
MTPALATWRRWTDLPLVALALGTLPLLLLELARDRLVRSDRLMLDVVGVVVLVAFTVDFVAELITCRARQMYLRREWIGIVIVVSQAAALVPALTAAGVFRALRAGRVVALVGALAGQGRSTLERHAASLALGTAGMVWLTSAVVFTLVEDVGVHGRVRSFFDALWWSTATITTVGYGDITPVTVVGRIVGMITMVVGISAFAVVTARIAQILVRFDERESEVDA